MTKTLTQISRQEFEAIPRRIATEPVSVQIEENRERAIANGCPLENADAYVVVGEKIRSFSMLFGQKVFDDNFRNDFDRIAAREGYGKNHPARKYVQTHHYGELSVLDIIYVARI